MNVLVDYVKHISNICALFQCAFTLPWFCACTRFIKIGLAFFYISIFELQLNNHFFSFMILN